MFWGLRPLCLVPSAVKKDLATEARSDGGKKEERGKNKNNKIGITDSHKTQMPFHLNSFDFAFDFDLAFLFLVLRVSVANLLTLMPLGRREAPNQISKYSYPSQYSMQS